MHPMVAPWLVQAMREVLQTGVPRQFDEVYIAGRDGTRHPAMRATLRLVRIWDRVLYTWRVLSAAEELHDQLLAAERIARIGSFSWDLRTDEQHWTPQLFELLGRADRRLPRSRHEIAALFAPTDRAIARRLVFAALRDRTVASADVRPQLRTGAWLRLTVEPMFDDGTPSVNALRGTVQDVTEERTEQARRHRVEEALAAHRQRRGAEQAVAEAFQQALLPTSGELESNELLGVRAMCQPIQRPGRVASGWYDLVRIDVDRALLVVGEVLADGPEATIAAARLCNAIRAYAVLGMSPAQLLEALDRLLTTVLPGERATMALAQYDRRSGQLGCASAGHSQPIRYRAEPGRGDLCGSLGPPLGEAAGRPYAQRSVPVQAGDLVLLHTDGLVVRRQQTSRAGLELLLDAADQVDLADPEAVAGYLSDKLGEPPEEDLCVIVGRVR
jgi:serine phosphatase RsbU (regulator of sigma subunit)